MAAQPHMLLTYALGSYVSMLSIVNPLMAAPVFFSLTEQMSAKARKKLAQQTAMWVGVILLVFFLAGSFILGMFGISLHAMRIAGGLMILTSALEKLNKQDRLTPGEMAEAESRAEHHDDIAFTPLAMPLMSGPGAIAVIIGMTADATTPSLYLAIPVVIALVSLTCFLALWVSPWLMRKLGQTLVRALSRIMGFILLCVGVQFVVNGVMGLIPAK